LTPPVILGYLKIFNFLWKLKRVEYTLSQCWSQHNFKKKEIQSLVEIRGDLHTTNLLRHEMIHFISNLHSYLQVEVLESAWNIFTDDVLEAENLDQIRSIQDKFIENILDKSLLSNSRNDIYEKIKKMFDLIHKFKFT